MLSLPIPSKPRPHRRMLLALAILSTLTNSEALFAKRLTESASSSSPTLSRSSGESSRSPNLGSPSDLAWQAWLFSDSQTGPHSTLLRRIKPKSVFIAPTHPTLPPCADGYRADTMGRCVKSVNIDQEAHFNFLLQQLNNRYASKGSSDGFSANPKKSSGPLQLNIPLLTSGADRKSLEDTEATASDHFAESSTTRRTENAVPVAEFIDDSNHTFSDVVDYKIPVDPRLNASARNASEQPNDSSRLLSNSTDSSPMLVLLSSTAVPNSIAALDEEQFDLEVDNSTEDLEILGARNDTGNKEVTDEAVPEADTEAPQLDLPRTVVEKVEDNETANSTEIDSETTQEVFYDDEAEAEAEDYADSTDVPEQESSKRTERTVLVV